MFRRSPKDKENPYAQISRDLAQDRTLSFQARGLLLYVLSKPPNWQARDEDLKREGGIGEKALASIVKELKARGYMVRTRETLRNGRFRWVTEISETPSPYPQKEGTVPYPPEAGMVDGGMVIDSTGAGAGSLVDHKELNKKRPAGYKVSAVPPEIKTLSPPDDFQITPEMTVWLAELQIGFDVVRLQGLTIEWRLAVDAEHSTRAITLSTWQAKWKKYVYWAWSNRNRKTVPQTAVAIEKCDPDRPRWMAGQKRK